MIAGPESLDPHQHSRAPQADALLNVFEPLVMTDEALKLQPALAESWRPLDDLTWEFKLRPGVRFHDGTEFQAADVVYSIRRVPNVAGSPTLVLFVSQISDFTIVGPHTLHIHTHEPAPTLPNYLARVYMVSAAAAQRVAGRTEAPLTVAEDPVAGGLVGTGPFTVRSWQPRGDLVLDRFGGYWRGPAYWDTVIRRELPNDSARVAALLAGQVDLINAVSSADYAALRRDPDVDTFVTDGNTVVLMFLDQRLRTPHVSAVDGTPLDSNPLRDVRVRQAIDLAVDRRILAEVVYEGLAWPANQVAPTAAFGFHPGLPDRVADAVRARQLLGQAGFPEGFQLELLCIQGRHAGDGEMCQAVGQMLTAAGLRVRLKAVPGAVFYSSYNRRDYSVAVRSFSTVTGEATYPVGALLHTEDLETGRGSSQRAEYSNPQVDELIQAALQEFGERERSELLARAVEIGMEDRAILPLVGLRNAWAARSGGVVYPPRADGQTLAYFVRSAR